MEWYEDEFEEGEEERRRDTKIDEAKREIVEFLQGNNRSVFFIKQLQVLLEAKFYHWIVGRAVAE